MVPNAGVQFRRGLSPPLSSAQPAFLQQQLPAAHLALHSSVQFLQQSGVHLPVQSLQQSAAQQDAALAPVVWLALITAAWAWPDLQQQLPAAQRALHSSVQFLQQSGVQTPVQSLQQSGAQQEEAEAAIT
ncbi:MAG: hypothetical protein EA380_03280 [Phycisphaeraceae bacterium]|nr:MAG: hypothetical protein EA380_03280 [Phycisphaeraceae bacterium]